MDNIDILDFGTIITRNPIYGYEDGERTIYIVEAEWDDDEWIFIDENCGRHTIDAFDKKSRDRLQALIDEYTKK